ncbi:MAG: hypothetical protein Q4A32_11710 [Lachnospiraceae bacterium]|nr:hypothetical protein [Lachnospiraceae bacterium]
MNKNQKNIFKKDWKKDIKMSYTETPTRPHRISWEEFDEREEELREELEDLTSEDFQVLAALADLLFGADEDDEEGDDEFWDEDDEFLGDDDVEDWDDDDEDWDEDEDDDIDDEEFDVFEDELKKLLAYQALRSLKEQMKSDIANIPDDEGNFPGDLEDRNIRILEELSGEPLPISPENLLRVHLELFDEFASEDAMETFHKYGHLEGPHFSRDVVVPADIPLYALHFVIQRAFGWQNSHMHSFALPDHVFSNLTEERINTWKEMVGVLLRSPLMAEEDEFWADDYEGGDFTKWLRGKYTGPYLSQCYGEGIISCRHDMEQLDMDAEYYLMFEKLYNFDTKKYDDEERITKVSPVYSYNGEKNPEPRPWGSKDIPYRVEVVKFADIPLAKIGYLYERDLNELLERLPLDSILASGEAELPDNCSEDGRDYIDSQIADSWNMVYDGTIGQVQKIIESKTDLPSAQPEIRMAVTDELIYSYDYGDGWKVRITASENCPELVKSGRITQDLLDMANIKCRDTYRPVLIAKDGDMMIDDVGGLDGFAEFLRSINPQMKGLSPEGKAAARAEKEEQMVWARGQGWTNRKFDHFKWL